jgi:hypothetical protein
MTFDELEAGDWHLRESDHEILGLLEDSVRELARLAQSGEALIGVGEVWDALETIDAGDGAYVEINVELSVGFRRGDRDFEEGVFAGIRVNSEEIVLDELNTTYSSDVGSDHTTRQHAVLGMDGSFPKSKVQGWLALLAEIRRSGPAELSVSRDHI